MAIIYFLISFSQREGFSDSFPGINEQKLNIRENDEDLTSIRLQRLLV